MDWVSLFNVLLVVLIAHFLIKNYKHYNYTVLPSISENFSESQTESETEKFIANYYEQDSVKRSRPEDIKQGNYYTNDWNDANFESNVMDVRNFFKINQPPSVSVPHRDADLIKVSKACFSDDVEGNQNKDIWEYKDEFVMNGAEFVKGVFGYSEDTPEYASFGDSKCVPQKDYSGCGFGKCDDDIRNGVGIPAQKWWKTN